MKREEIVPYFSGKKSRRGCHDFLHADPVMPDWPDRNALKRHPSGRFSRGDVSGYSVTGMRSGSRNASYATVAGIGLFL